MPEFYNDFIYPLMQSENSIVKDPLGNIVFLSAEICLYEQAGLDSNDPVAKIIESPAYMVEVLGKEMYYIRAVDWDNILLVEVQMKQEKWVAGNCMRNPSRQYIRSLISKGKLITKW